MENQSEKEEIKGEKGQMRLKFKCDIEVVVWKQKVISQMCMKLRAIECVTAVDVIKIKN